jgi:hypothetical protein
MKTKLTPYQKLQALHDRFYSNMKWEPKKGDYYTTSRNDLELYHIIDEDEEYVYTIYCTDPNQNRSKWKKSEFTSQGFGPCRVYVHGYIIGTDENYPHLMPNGIQAPENWGL